MISKQKMMLIKNIVQFISVSMSTIPNFFNFLTLLIGFVKGLKVLCTNPGYVIYLSPVNKNLTIILCIYTSKQDISSNWNTWKWISKSQMSQVFFSFVFLNLKLLNFFHRFFTIANVISLVLLPCFQQQFTIFSFYQLQSFFYVQFFFWAQYSICWCLYPTLIFFKNRQRNEKRKKRKKKNLF